MSLPCVPPTTDDFYEWLRKHPAGLLLNQPARGRFTMHKTSCMHLTENEGDKPTWTKLEKACADGSTAAQDLEFWAWKVNKTKPHICGTCRPKD